MVNLNVNGDVNNAKREIKHVTFSYKNNYYFKYLNDFSIFDNIGLKFIILKLVFFYFITHISMHQVYQEDFN